MYITSIYLLFSQPFFFTIQGIFGEFYVTPERYATMTGRGRDHAMCQAPADWDAIRHQPLRDFTTTRVVKIDVN
jgi:hypothetical protein